MDGLYTLAARQFQSTHPARGATAVLERLQKQKEAISIHAPREGCDWVKAP